MKIPTLAGMLSNVALGFLLLAPLGCGKDRDEPSAKPASTASTAAPSRSTSAKTITIDLPFFGGAYQITAPEGWARHSGRASVVLPDRSELYFSPPDATLTTAGVAAELAADHELKARDVVATGDEVRWTTDPVEGDNFSGPFHVEVLAKPGGLSCRHDRLSSKSAVDEVVTVCKSVRTR
ncbi:MAG: hypothetical protein M3680_17350 [Myxococcota bacterium]|nr:hypothetical protein [Myxococcota bacterium]